MNPGIYDIAINEYHEGAGISRSLLVEFLKSPYHYWYKKNYPEIRESVEIIRKTNALEFGNALHTIVLEPDTFNDRYSVIPKVNRATKIGKELYSNALELGKGKTLICVEAWQVLRDMACSIKIHADANLLISDALYEKSIYWNDPVSQMLCKVRPDIWHNDFIADLKTCISASPHDFQRAIFSYGYHIQCGMIHEAIKCVTGRSVTNFIFIAIEKDPPYAVAVYQLDLMSLEHGIRQFKTIIKGIKECTDKNEWPCYPTQTISLPNWAFKLEDY